MDFEAAQAYLLATINETVSRRMPYRLERMRAFMHELGDPQDRVSDGARWRYERQGLDLDDDRGCACARRQAGRLAH